MQTRGKDTRCLSPCAAFTSKQRLIKKKSMRTCLSVVLFYLLPLDPFRIEAVIKILTFRVFLFPYVLILIESSDALPFSASSHLRVMREGLPLPFSRSRPSRSWRPRDTVRTMPLHAVAASFNLAPCAALHTNQMHALQPPGPSRSCHPGGVVHSVPRHAMTVSTGLYLAPCAALHTSRMHALHPADT